ncbi:MAG TPA: hypothetical protein VGD50_00260 [Candidatus Baltobacteraceae bacterium]
MPEGTVHSPVAATGAPEGRALRIEDRSPWPRAALSGAESVRWLITARATLPNAHSCAIQQDGSLLVRLSPTEFLALGQPGIANPGGLASFAFDGSNEPGVCPIPSFAATVWFVVTGVRAAEMMAKICGIDLAPKAFANHRAARTIVARTSATVIRDDEGEQLRFHLLADWTLGAYLWDVLEEAAREFNANLPP